MLCNPMPCRIEDYALIGDCETAALVGRDGSIDWLCWPRFDSDACFAALLGTPEQRPLADRAARRRRCASRAATATDTLILETRFETDDGAATLIDFMPLRDAHSNIVRLVVGRARQRGDVPAARDPLRLRRDRAVGDAPAGRRAAGDRRARHAGAAHAGRTARRGPEDGRRIHRDGGRDGAVRLTYAPSHLPPPAPADPARALAATRRVLDRLDARGARPARRGPTRSCARSSR